jgi:hypothetical protein
MKALSIYAPYVDAIAEGEKTVECRSWATNHRGDLLICAASKNQKDWHNFFVRGHALCVVTLADCEPFARKHRKGSYLDDPPSGGYAWILKNVRFIKPIPIKGQQRLFEVDIEPEYLNLKFDEARQLWFNLGLVAEA